MKSWKGIPGRGNSKNRARGVSGTPGDSVFQPEEGHRGRLREVKESVLGGCLGPGPGLGVGGEGTALLSAILSACCLAPHKIVLLADLPRAPSAPLGLAAAVK